MSTRQPSTGLTSRALLHVHAGVLTCMESLRPTGTVGAMPTKARLEVGEGVLYAAGDALPLTAGKAGGPQPR